MEWQESRLLQKHNRMLTKNKPTPPQKRLLYFQAFYFLTHDPVESNINIKHHIKQYYFTGSLAVNGDSELCFLFFFSAQESPVEDVLSLELTMFPGSSPVSRSTKQGNLISVSTVPKSSA